MKAIIAVCLLTLSTVAASFAQLKSLPYGIYYFPALVSNPVKSDDPTKWNVWNNSHVPGAVARESWAELEPTEGTFNFGKYLDPIVSLSTSKGKQLEITVNSGVHGKYQFWPQWLKNSGAQFITFPSSGLTVPVPWDPIFQTKWHAVITALGQRYDGLANLHVVQMQGPGRGSELAFGENETDYAYLNNTFGTGWIQLWQQAAETIAGFYMNAFVQTPLIYSNGRPLPTKVDKKNTAYAAVVNYLNNTYNNSGNSVWRFGDRSSGYYLNAPAIPFYSEYGLTFQGYQEDVPKGTTAAQECAQLPVSPYFALWFEVYDKDCAIQANDGAYNKFNAATQPK
jgi:hypothetical protein